MNREEGLPFALIRWIKAEQEKERKHQEYWALKNAEDDKQYLAYMAQVVPLWINLKKYEQTLLMNFHQWKDSGRNFTPQQRSAIAGMYYRHVLETEK
jgi:hypothetical protein